MRKKDIHNLIEQQNPEAKQRIWKKIQCALSEHEKQNDKQEDDNKGKAVLNENE